MQDLVLALDQYLKTNKVRLRNVFDSCSPIHAGPLSHPPGQSQKYDHLDVHGLAKLLRFGMPDVTNGEALYFQAMLANEAGEITYQGFAEVARESLGWRLSEASDASAHEGMSAETQTVMEKLDAHLTIASAVSAGRVLWTEGVLYAVPLVAVLYLSKFIL